MSKEPPRLVSVVSGKHNASKRVVRDRIVKQRVARTDRVS